MKDTNFYVKTSCLLFILFGFVAIQLYFMYPRKIVYREAIAFGDECYVNVRNYNYRPVNLLLSVMDRTVEYRVKGRSEELLEIGEVNGEYVDIKDTFGNEVRLFVNKI
jgi:hypothetical protein